MLRHRRHSEVPSLNTSSTADISFMLLIFFLVTSSMDATKGMRRQLPPPPQEQEQVADISKDDIMTVTLTADNVTMLNGDTVTEQRLMQEVRQFAAVNPRQRVVAISVSPEATYDAYFQLQNALVTAYRPLKCAPRTSETVEETGSEKGGEP